jgi:hypothetical protein
MRLQTQLMLLSWRAVLTWTATSAMMPLEMEAEVKSLLLQAGGPAWLLQKDKGTRLQTHQTRRNRGERADGASPAVMSLLSAAGAAHKIHMADALQQGGAAGRQHGVPGL